MKENPYNSRFFLWLNKTPIEENKQPYRDICTSYGLGDQKTIERLADIAFEVFVYSRIDQFGELESKDYQYRKDLATLASIFGYGRGITIQAALPDGEFKEKHIKLKVEAGGLLQRLAFLSINTLLANTIDYNMELEGECGVERRGKGKMPYWIDTSGTIFRKPYSNQELSAIIEHESKKEASAKAMQGRKEWAIPKLGGMVHSFIEAGGDVLAAVVNKYMLIGDLMLAAGVNPVEQVVWKEVLSNKEKSDMVQYWEESYINVINKER